MFKLILPSIEYKISFLEATKEFQKDGLFTDLDISDLEKDFPAFITKQLNHSQGKDLPEGFVAETVYWLLDDDEFIGRVVIRHELTETLLREGGHIGYAIKPSKRKKGYGTEILKSALLKAKELGLKKVLLTCNENNLGSKKIIESNGGIFQDRIFLQQGKPWKLRYWINLSFQFSG